MENVASRICNKDYEFFTTAGASIAAAALLKDGVEIGRAFPPYDLWARVSIGLPEENAIAHAAVRKLLRKSPA